MVGEWRRMDQGVMLHDLEDLDNLAQRYRVLLAASQVVQRVVDECNELRTRATTPDDLSAWQLLVMRVGVAQEKIADLNEHPRDPLKSRTYFTHTLQRGFSFTQVKCKQSVSSPRMRDAAHS